MSHIDIVVSQYCNTQILKRTLESLSSVIIPPAIKTIYVVENGPISGAEKVCNELGTKIPVKYVYEAMPGLVHARNRGISESIADYIIFIDNDLTFVEGTLQSYVDAFEEMGQDYFYGGPLLPDYEKLPPKWLVKYLPYSARGFQPNDNNAIVSDITFLGGNHAISRKSIDKLNRGSNVYTGAGATGTGGGVGEETRLQKELISLGFKGYYVSTALVYHYIPKEVCTLKWVKNRRYRHGLEDSEKIFNNSKKLIFGLPPWVLKELIKTYLYYFMYIFTFNKEGRVKSCLEIGRYKGVIDGVLRKYKNAD